MSWRAEDLTVVIVAIVGGAAFERCKAAVRSLGLRLVAVDRDGGCVDVEGRNLCSAEVTNVPARRARAAKCVDTPLIAFIEDTVVPRVGWAEAVCAALNSPGVAGVAGPVSISSRLPARCRALGLTEYARFHSSNFTRLQIPAAHDRRYASVSAIPGANFAFRRDALAAVLPPSGLIEHEVLAMLHEKGLGVVYASEMHVDYREPFTGGARLSTRFAHGRIYASRALTGAGTAARTAAALKACALPAVLISRAVGDSRRARQFSAGALSWVLLMSVSWSAGELSGALFGASRAGLDDWT